MSNRTDIVVETDNAEGQVLLSASRVYDLTEDKTQDTINSEIRNTLNQLEGTLTTIERTGTVNTGSLITKGTFFYLNSVLVQALIAINTNAAFSDGVNYKAVSDTPLNGALNASNNVEDFAANITFASAFDGDNISCKVKDGVAFVSFKFYSRNGGYVPTATVIATGLPAPAGIVFAVAIPYVSTEYAFPVEIITGGNFRISYDRTLSNGYNQFSVSYLIA